MTIRHSSPLFLGIFLLFAGGGVIPEKSAAAASASDGGLAARIIEIAGYDRGVCAILGAGDTGLALELAGPDAFMAHVLEPDSARVAAALKQADIDARYGRSLIIEKSPLDKLPYADNLVDIILATRLKTQDLDNLSLPEILRCLRPGGFAFLGRRSLDKEPDGLSATALRSWAAKSKGADSIKVASDEFGLWLKITKPSPKGVDEWTHWEHGPDNNPVSTDEVIKAPYMTQFLGLPFYSAMPAITVAAGGRVFTAMGHIAHHKREEPWLNTLVACNGYNGTILWTRKLPDGYLVHRSAFIASADTFTMIDPDGEGALMLDPQTGEEKGHVRIPRHRGEWKWMAREGDTLFALVGKEKDPPETTILRSDLSHWSWGGLSKGYYEEQVPWGFGNTIVAYDLKRNKLLWSHAEEGKIDSRAMTIGGGSVFFYGPEARMGCLDATTGFLRWANADSETHSLIDTPGVGLTSTPGFKTACYALYTPKALYFEGQTLQNVVAVSTENGKLLWHRSKTTSNPNPIFLEDKLLIGIGEDGDTLEVDPLTGDILADLGFKKRSCTRLTATPDSLFCRGFPEGFTRYDRESGEIQFNGAMRPACNDGAIGANGLLYTGPWMCDCNLSLMGRVVLCSAGDFNFDVTAADGERLEAGDTVVQAGHMLKTSEGDWPYYRGNSSHTGSTGVSIPREANKVWEWHPDGETKLTAPVIAGGLGFAGGDDGKIRALSVVTGELKWTYRTAGPIPQAPCVWEGRVYAGSADGYAYCLEAATGRLLWRFRASPYERRTMVYSALSSTWPVNSGVLVKGGVAYLGAGIIDYDGTYVYALDAKTGKIIWQNNSTGHLDKKLRKGVSVQGIMTTALDRLWMAGGNVVSPAVYDLKAGEFTGEGPGDGSPQSNRGEEIGFLNADFMFLGGRLRNSATENVVDPGTFIAWGIAKETPNMPLCSGKIPPVWDDQRFVFVDGRNTKVSCWTRQDFDGYLASRDKSKRPAPAWTSAESGVTDTVALALGKDGVVSVEETPPTNNLLSTWSICCLDSEKGSMIWKRPLPSAALPSSLAVDGDEHMVLVLADGEVLCFGGPRALEQYISGLADSAKLNKDNPAAIQRLRQSLSEVYGPKARNQVIRALDDLGVRVGQEAEERGCIIRWKLAGPFPWDDPYPNDMIWINEPNADITKSYEVEGKVLTWQDYVTDERDGLVDLEVFYGPIEDVAAYAYAEIELPKECDLLLRTGSNDGFIAWFNGEEVGRFDAGRGYRPDTDSLPVHAKAGKNSVLMKITQMGNRWQFSARLTDLSEAPVNLARK
jgi:outer membrane protein assembly factor BamB